MAVIVRGTFTAMAVVYVLLALQAEPITKTLGFICAGVLVIALFASKVERTDDA